MAQFNMVELLTIQEMFIFFTKEDPLDEEALHQFVDAEYGFKHKFFFNPEDGYTDKEVARGVFRAHNHAVYWNA